MRGPSRRALLRAAALLPPAVLVPGLAAAEAPLRINTHSALWPLGPSDRGPGVFQAVVEAAAEGVGRRVDLALLPAERSLRLVSAGVDDGDGPRIEQMDQLYPSLRRVDEPLLDYRFVAFAPPGVLRGGSWESLLPHHVAIVRGWKILENRLSGAASLQSIRTPRLLFDQLARGRAEAVVFEESMGIGLLEERGLTGRLAPVQPPLAVRPMFLFVHRRHGALAEQLAHGLRRLKESGRGREIVDRVLGGRPVADFPGIAAHWGGS